MDTCCTNSCARVRNFRTRSPSSYNTAQSNWTAYMLFNSQTGTVGTGFIGYFNSDRTTTNVSTTISNPFSSFYAGEGVQITDYYNKPFCETIAGVQICDDFSHNYTAREYYLPGIGFCGFYRQGTSTFTGGGYGTTYASTMISIYL